MHDMSGWLNTHISYINAPLLWYTLTKVNGLETKQKLHETDEMHQVFKAENYQLGSRVPTAVLLSQSSNKQ